MDVGTTRNGLAARVRDLQARSRFKSCKISDTAVGIGTGCVLDGREVLVRVPGRTSFTPLHVANARPTSYPVSEGRISSGRKAAAE
jgi:hypothetical protein